MIADHALKPGDCMSAVQPGTSGTQGILWVVATPIGHRDDLSPRACAVLREVALIAAEDTRHSRPLLAHHGIATPLAALHQHNEREAVQGLLARRAAGQGLALVSRACQAVGSCSGI